MSAHAPRCAVSARLIEFIVLSLLLVGLAPGCGGGPTGPDEAGPAVIDVQVALVDDRVVFGGPLLMEVGGAGLLDPVAVRVILQGRLNEAPIDATLVSEFEAEAQTIDVRVPWEAMAPFVDSSASELFFEGDVVVVVEDVTGQFQGRAVSRGAQVLFLSQLTPSWTPPQEALEVHLGEVTRFEAEELLQEGEGESVLVLDGTLTADNGGTRRISATIPMSLSGRTRSGGEVSWPASVFGVRPGAFEGLASVRNEHSRAASTETATTQLRVELLPAQVLGFDPPAAGRGQRISVLGQGFIALNAGLAQSMFLEMEGTFLPRDGGEALELFGADVWRLAPDSVPSHTEARLTLRTETSDTGRRVLLTGISARPGTFTGTVTPVLLDANAQVRGVPYEGSFVIEPTRQYVFVKFLPGFSEALDDFGLRNVETEIRARVFAVLARDFAGLNIVFEERRPDDFAEYSVIEVGGDDPNGVGLLGLDNTAGKDVGNVRLDDVIGGENAESGELGFYVYGGVFIRSFLLFSPSLELEEENELASPEYDRIFANFAPVLGGSPIGADEPGSGGGRQIFIDEAIRVMGNLIGNTISHEIGHSLGLAFYPEDLEAPTSRFHNPVDEPNALMDGGRERPFEERAELGGQGPAAFNVENRAYLEQILPMP